MTLTDLTELLYDSSTRAGGRDSFAKRRWTFHTPMVANEIGISELEALWVVFGFAAVA